MALGAVYNGVRRVGGDWFAVALPFEPRVDRRGVP